MDKKRKELIIILGLAVVFILTLASSIRKIRQRFGPSSAVPAAASVDLLSASSTVSSPEKLGIAPPIIKKAQEKENLDWIRDPFSGKIYFGKEEVVDLTLTGIVWDEKKPQALINGNVVQEGSRIGQFKVLKIYKDKVRLDQGATSFELKLKQ